MINRNLDFDGFAPFRMTVRYLNMTGEDIVTTDESHVHSECEIYINVSGDVLEYLKMPVSWAIPI